MTTITWEITQDDVERLEQILRPNFTSDDFTINKLYLDDEAEKQSALYRHYSDLYAKVGRFRNIAERQLKYVRAIVDLDYRRGMRNVPTEIRITDASVKALVEADEDVGIAENVYTSILYLFNKIQNRVTAMEHKRDMIRILSKSIEKINYA